MGVWVDVGAGVGGSGASVGTGVSVAGVCVGSDVAFGPCELAGNGVVAALGTVVSVGVACGVSVCSGAGVTGLGADVAPSTEAETVATASLGVGAWPPQASRAATITRVVHRDILKFRSPFFPSRPAGLRNPYSRIYLCSDLGSTCFCQSGRRQDKRRPGGCRACGDRDRPVHGGDAGLCFSETCL